MKFILSIAFWFSLCTAIYAQDHILKLEGGVELSPKKIYRRSQIDIYTYKSIASGTSEFNKTVNGDFVVAIYDGWFVLWQHHDNSYFAYRINEIKDYTGAVVYILWKLDEPDYRHQLVIDNNGVVDLYLDVRNNPSENRFLFKK